MSRTLLIPAAAGAVVGAGFSAFTAGGSYRDLEMMILTGYGAALGASAAFIAPLVVSDPISQIAVGAAVGVAPTLYQVTLNSNTEEKMVALLFGGAAGAAGVAALQHFP